jgi:Mg2+/Co2+ transporter CorB
VTGLFGLLAALICLSAFFSGSETALMSINRYRLRHKARAGHRGAILANRLLERPDRLIGLILLGNNLVNILATMVTTLIALRLYDESALGIAAALLTIVLLIFAEVTPKTLSAIKPEVMAYPAAYIYTPLALLAYPIVWLVNFFANGLLRLAGISAEEGSSMSLSREEMSTVVREAGALLPKGHRNMLLNILALEEATVEDIMVPRNEVDGIDLDEDWDEILDLLHHVNHTRIPLYRESIDNIVGIVHTKRIMRLMADDDFDKEALEKAAVEPYFIPEGTRLTKQMLHFQQQKRRMALVVDEYGDLLGLVTLEDILEEIIGEFTTDAVSIKDIHQQADGSVLIDGGVHVRDLKKAFKWPLPTDGPKTLNGLILEHMEMIPEPGTSVMLYGLPVEIIKTQKNTVKTVRAFPQKRRKKVSSKKKKSKPA